MSSSAFTPTILQEFREASVSQSGIVNTTAQTFSGHKLVKSTTGQQITAYGWSTERGGASDNDGEIRLGIGPTAGFRIQQYDSGATTTYFDSRYDSVSSLIQFRTRTDGTPVVAFQYTGAGSFTIGPAGGTASQTVNGVFQARGTNTSAPQVGVPHLGATSYAGVTIANDGTAKTITTGGIYSGGLFLIRGIDSGNTGHRWIDLVHCGDSSSWTGGFTVISSKTLNSPPSTRTYSFSGSTIQVTLSGGTSGNYDVGVGQIFT
jgi:hypothetical protein